MPLIRWLLNVKPLWNSPEEFDQALQYLPRPTRTTILKYLRPADRKLALGSQILQHLLVSRFRQIPFSKVRIIKHHAGISGGRPVFAGFSDGNIQIEGLEYNVSHHGSVVAIVSRLQKPLDLEDGGVGGGIGVDVLPYEVRPEYVEDTVEGVLEWVEGFGEGGVFTCGEVKAVKEAIGMGKIVGEKVKGAVKALHLNWTLKEAYVKAVGTGLVNDLLAVDFVLGDTAEKLEEGRLNDDSIEVWLGIGEERRKGSKWYFEVEKVRIPGVDGEEGVYCVAVATKIEELEEAEKMGQWEWLSWDEDISPVIHPVEQGF